MAYTKKIGVIGNGSWSSAIVKVLTENKIKTSWWMRSQESMRHIQERHHNPHYLTTVTFDTNYIHLQSDLNTLIQNVDIILIGIPSAYIVQVLETCNPTLLKEKIILSAIKGIIPVHNVLLHQYLHTHFQFPIEQYVCIAGPCHAEEIAADKLSYLTFVSSNEQLATDIATLFITPYLHTITSTDIWGVQYAAVLKNIYALGAGIAHGLDYGDNFLSVYITNCFAEMQQFMEKIATHAQHHYNTSAYLGDLLVTCYSLHSRNRTFGNYIGKGYSAAAAKLELNMVAEGYYACKGIHDIAAQLNHSLPIVNHIYAILWQAQSPINEFKQLEQQLK